VASTGQLALIIHHLAVDGVSWRILLEDLNIAWAQHRGGQPVALPAAGTSFRRWASLLGEYARSSAVVDQAGALIGIVTDGDIRRHVASGIENRTAAEVMTSGPKIARPDQLAAEALALMTEKKITQLFVLAEGDAKPLGVIHIHDCLRAGLA